MVDHIADVRGVLAAHLPGYRVDAVVPLGEGLDNVAYEVNGDLIVRRSRERDPTRLTNEANLLAIVAEVSPLPVPEPTFTAAEQGWMAYPKLPGVPLLDLHHRSTHHASIAARLTDLLHRIHAIQRHRIANLVDIDDHPLTGWRREAADNFVTVTRSIPAEYRPRIEAFLDAAPPPASSTVVFSHNDLGIEHVLVDPHTWRVSGVIDWSDAALVDPARDFGLLYRDLGPAAIRASTPAFRERAVFYARCSVFEDLAYGIATGRDRYVDKSLAAMAWLFPA